MAASISFQVSPSDRALIDQIADRTIAQISRMGMAVPDRLDIVMDLSAAQAQGANLDLERLLAFDDLNFAHDVGGLRAHLDRDTGLLGGHFRPRCTRSERSAWA